MNSFQFETHSLLTNSNASDSKVNQSKQDLNTQKAATSWSSVVAASTTRTQPHSPNLNLKRPSLSNICIRCELY